MLSVIYWSCVEIWSSEVVKFFANKMIRKTYFLVPYLTINLISGCCDKIFFKNMTLWVKVSPRVVIPRFQDPMQVLWLIRHSWISKITDSEASSLLCQEK